MPSNNVQVLRVGGQQVLAEVAPNGNTIVDGHPRVFKNAAQARRVVGARQAHTNRRHGYHRKGSMVHKPNSHGRAR